MTTIAGAFNFSLDVRAYDEHVLAALEAEVLRIAGEIERDHDVRFALGARATAKVGHLAPEIADQLTGAAEALGIPVMPLASPASHDAAAFAAAGIRAGMIFVRNSNGSHNPDEAMDIGDFRDGTAILAQFLYGWACGRAG